MTQGFTACFNPDFSGTVQLNTLYAPFHMTRYLVSQILRVFLEDLLEERTLYTSSGFAAKDKATSFSIQPVCHLWLPQHACVHEPFQCSSVELIQGKSPCWNG